MFSLRVLALRSSGLAHNCYSYPTPPVNIARALSLSCSKMFDSRRLPCSKGDTLANVDTPALLIDMDAMEENMRKLPIMLKKYPGVHARPHCKAHKSPEIAKIQSQFSQVDRFCAQKLHEAEALVDAGILDIFVTNEIVGKRKMERLMALAKAGKISICVDSCENVSALSASATKEKVTIGCVVELNVGQNRCGVQTPEEVLELAKLVQESPGLDFKGVQGYQGALQHVRGHSERHDAVANVAARTKEAVELLSANGISCEVVTGGGTGTFEFEAGSGVYNEVQPGSYIFNDADYGRNLGENGMEVLDSIWKNSLHVLTTVMSTNKSGGWVVVDAGLKAVSLDSGPPLVTMDGVSPCDWPKFENGGDEHGKVVFKPESAHNMPSLGQTMLLIPGHCDPTVNMYDYFVCHRNGVVEAVVPILGRGPGL